MRKILSKLKNAAMLALVPILIIGFLPLLLLWGVLAYDEPGDQDPWDH